MQEQGSVAECSCRGRCCGVPGPQAEQTGLMNGMRGHLIERCTAQVTVAVAAAAGKVVRAQPRGAHGGLHAAQVAAHQAVYLAEGGRQLCCSRPHLEPAHAGTVGLPETCQGGYSECLHDGLMRTAATLHGAEHRQPEQGCCAHQVRGSLPVPRW